MDSRQEVAFRIADTAQTPSAPALTPGQTPGREVVGRLVVRHGATFQAVSVEVVLAPRPVVGRAAIDAVPGTRRETVATKGTPQVTRALEAAAVEANATPVVGQGPVRLPETQVVVALAVARPVPLGVPVAGVAIPLRPTVVAPVGQAARNVVPTPAVAVGVEVALPRPMEEVPSGLAVPPVVPQAVALRLVGDAVGTVAGGLDGRRVVTDALQGRAPQVRPVVALGPSPLGQVVGREEALVGLTQTLVGAGQTGGVVRPHSRPFLVF